LAIWSSCSWQWRISWRRLGSTTMQLWIGNSTAKVNGKDIPTDKDDAKVVPEIINSRTMIPLRFVAENLGCDVLWDAATKTVTIKYPKSQSLLAALLFWNYPGPLVITSGPAFLVRLPCYTVPVNTPYQCGLAGKVTSAISIPSGQLTEKLDYFSPEVCLNSIALGM